MPEVPAEFAWRLARARAAMAAAGDGAGVEVLLLDSGESLAWLSGYTVSETMYRGVFVPREGDPWIVLRGLDESPCREGGWITDVVGYPDTASPEAVMVAELARRGHAGVRLGVDDTSIGWNPRRQAVFAQAADVVAMTGVTESLRWVKSATEIGHLAQAAAIADSAMAEVAAAARPGLTTREAAARVSAHFLRNGADTGETGPIVRGRGNHEFLHGLFRTEALEAGDILHVELIPYVNRYGARLMRPIVIGGASAAQRSVAAELIALQDAQIAAMKPGAIASEVDAILRNGVLRAGLRPEYTNVTAYTLGLYSRTPRSSDFSRVFLPDQHWQLEEGMVFHVYCTAQGLGFSETVVVTPEGGKRLTSTPRAILGTAD